VPVARSQFRSLCRERPREDLVAFVAGLAEARGRPVDRLGGGRLRVDAPDGPREVAVRQPAEYGADGLDGADRAVVLGVLDTDDPRVRDIDDLHRELCYAVDRSDARRLVATHFGREPGRLPDPTPPRDRDGANRWPPSPGWPGPGVTSAVVLTALGVFVLVVGVPGAPGLSATDAGSDPVEPVGVDDWGLAPVPEGEGGQASVDDYPTGVSADGTVDARVLSRVHRVTLDDHSYTARLRYREYRNGTLAGRYTEVLQVANESHYASRVATTGSLEGAPMRIATADIYADGSREYVRKDGDQWSLTVRDGDPFLPRVRNYLAWKFSVNETAVERTPTGVRVRFAGDAYGTGTPVTGYAVVTEEGLVRSLRRSYELESGTRVVVTLNTTNVGETTVEKPAWVS
jgi:hypothetical protein